MEGTNFISGQTAPVLSAATTVPLLSGPELEYRKHIPAHFPNIPGDPNCNRCKGTGYKKSSLSGKWKGYKRCALKYGTNLSTLNLSALSGNMIPTNYPKLIANPQCVKCSGTGYRMSRRLNNWAGCKQCAQQYGTNLPTLNLPTY